MRGLRSAGIAALLLRARLSFWCDYPPYGSHDPTIAVCIVWAAGTHWKTSRIHGISVDMLSCHDLPRRMLLRWFVQLLSILSCLACIAVIQQCTGIADCHILSSPTARGLPTLESLDEHDRLVLLAEPKHVHWQTTSRSYSSVVMTGSVWYRVIFQQQRKKGPKRTQPCLTLLRMSNGSDELHCTTLLLTCHCGITQSCSVVYICNRSLGEPWRFNINEGFFLLTRSHDLLSSLKANANDIMLLSALLQILSNGEDNVYCWPFSSEAKRSVSF